MTRPTSEMDEAQPEDKQEEAAECKRNGHRDSGRGQCVDCDEFI